MSAYLIIQATVHNWEKFTLYTQAVTPLIKKFGGRNNLEIFYGILKMN